MSIYISISIFMCVYTQIYEYMNTYTYMYIYINIHIYIACSDRCLRSAETFPTCVPPATARSTATLSAAAKRERPVTATSARTTSTPERFSSTVARVRSTPDGKGGVTQCQDSGLTLPSVSGYNLGAALNTSFIHTHISISVLLLRVSDPHLVGSWPSHDIRVCVTC